jgi:hypothetical protein
MYLMFRGAYYFLVVAFSVKVTIRIVEKLRQSSSLQPVDVFRKLYLDALGLRVDDIVFLLHDQFVRV